MELSEVIKQVADLVAKKAGIVMGPKQYPMIENRLKSRMIKLSLNTVDQYAAYLQNNESSESEALLSLMTTHHTFFFREFSHFEFLRDQGLKHLVNSLKAKGKNKLKIWSAACSRGQEVYSLGMFLNYHLKQIDSKFDFEIWGTDIDPESVQMAQTGSYPKEDLKSSPQIYLANHWRLDPLNPENLKIGAEIKSKVHFSAENLLDLNRFLQNKEFDIIFCRNVFIYFEKAQIENITKKFLQHLNLDGYLFVGVSESITNYGLPIKALGASIYISKEQKPTTIEVIKEPIRNIKTTPYQVLVVDDSKTIHALMKKIFTKDQGYEIAQIVSNGQEALNFLKANPNKVEMITLDLHMPELDGIGFLNEFKDRSIPILVVSAVDRDDTEGPGQQALKLGAFDYVEKPTVENLEQIGNEIRSKLATGLNILKPQFKPEPKPKPFPKPLSNSTTQVSGIKKNVLLKTKSTIPLGGLNKAKINPTNKKSNKLAPIGLKSKALSTTLAPKKPSPFGLKKTLVKKATGVGSQSAKPLKIDSKQSVSSKIKVLVVDDSATVRKILVKIISEDKRFEVVGETAHPLEVEKLIRELKPQLMTFDIHMPDMDGVTLLKKVFPLYKIPTVMISSISLEEGGYVLDALEHGAVDYIQKPSMNELSTQKAEICDRLYIASQAKAKKFIHRTTPAPKINSLNSNEGLIVIGSSTGGTEALRVVFENLPTQIPPILVTQHIPAVFSKALADRLNTLFSFTVKEAEHGDLVQPNHVYIAPGGKQMGVIYKEKKLFIKITDEAPVNRHKPSVDYLFDSIVKAQLTVEPIIGVILTGMGGDGAKGLKLLRDNGAKTIGQDESSSVVYGMPKVAFELGAVEHQVPLTSVGSKIMQLLSQINRKKEENVA